MDESKRLKASTSATFIRGQIFSLMLLGILGGSAAMVGVAFGVPLERVAAVVAAAHLLGRPIAILHRGVYRALRAEQQKHEADGNAEGFTGCHSASVILTVAIFAFTFLFWFPLRWGVVALVALGVV